jgi:hypothetical protein
MTLRALLARINTLSAPQAVALWLALFLPPAATVIAVNAPSGHARPISTTCPADNTAPDCPTEGTP